MQIEKGPAAFERSIVSEKGPNDNSTHAESQRPSCQGLIARHFSGHDTFLEVKFLKGPLKMKGPKFKSGQ